VTLSSSRSPLQKSQHLDLPPRLETAHHDPSSGSREFDSDSGNRQRHWVAPAVKALTSPRPSLVIGGSRPDPLGPFRAAPIGADRRTLEVPVMRPGGSSDRRRDRARERRRLLPVAAEQRES
jgi:hypothetical protein